MKPVFDEYKLAEQIISKGFINDMSYYELSVIAKYYFYLGYSKNEIRSEIVSFCKKWIIGFNEIKNEKIMDSLVKNIKNRKLKMNMSIIVTKKEIENIRTLNNFTYEKVLFVMLVMSKYNNLQSNSPSQNYYVSEKFSTILNMSKVYLNKDEKMTLKHHLYLNKMIECCSLNAFSIKYSTNKEDYRILCVDNNSETYLTIEDMDNIVDHYKPYCAICGKQIEGKKRNNILLCKEHYEEKRRADKLIWWNQNH